MAQTQNDTGVRRRQLLFQVLAAVFLTNALVAEVVGGKLFQVDFLGSLRTLSVGVLLWPVVFVTSDIVNEYFGRAGVRRLSIIGAVMIAYSFFALWACGVPTAASFSPVQEAAYTQVFFQSQWIIVGSIIAFLSAQLLDTTVFWLLRRRTGRGQLWLRATGSTVVSQLLDTFVVGFIGLHVPRLLWGPSMGVDFPTYINGAFSGYVFKLVVALGTTPLLYIIHNVIDRWLGPDAETLIDTAASGENGA